MTHAANLPRHLYVSVDRSVMSRGHGDGWEDAVWFGLTSVPHRAWGCTVMLQCGALYRGLPLSAIAHDGHARRGDFLPPVPLPRRMWAGGRIEWRASLRVGDAATRTSEIVAVEPKRGRTGTLVFVTVRHTLSTARGACIVEEHDIVYREAPAPGAPAVAVGADAPQAAAWHRHWLPDAVMLFRYSALTFNGHRIHYDQPYVTGEEGYPGLVVHGPLQATLLLHLAAGALPGRRLARFEYRALSPAFAGEPLEVHGQPEGDPAGAVGEARLWATTTHGRRTMAGTVAWAAAD